MFPVPAKATVLSTNCCLQLTRLAPFSEMVGIEYYSFENNHVGLSALVFLGRLHQILRPKFQSNKGFGLSRNKHAYPVASQESANHCDASLSTACGVHLYLIQLCEPRHARPDSRMPPLFRHVSLTVFSSVLCRKPYVTPLRGYWMRVWEPTG